MPELPEAEVVRRGLDDLVRGRVVHRFEVGRDRAVRRDPDVEAQRVTVVGRTVVATGRVGKFLVLDLGAPTGAGGPAPVHDVVIVHLGMSGQLRTGRAGTDRPAHTHVVWTLDAGTELRFVDPRTFGHVFRSTAPGAGARPLALGHLGPDALDELTAADLAAGLAGRRVAVKARLLDQTAVAGLGNIYTDEILHRVGIAPGRPSRDVGPVEVEALVGATRAVLSEAIAAGGSSLRDGQYVDLAGRVGGYQDQHRVHARAGSPCPSCGTVIERELHAGRTASWCPGCQA